MKTITISILLFVAALCFGCKPAQKQAPSENISQETAQGEPQKEIPDAEGVQIFLEVDKEKFLADEPVKFGITVTYEQKGDDLTRKNLDFLPHIIGADGKEIPLQYMPNTDASEAIPIRSTNQEELSPEQQLAVAHLRGKWSLDRFLTTFVPTVGQSTYCGGDIRWVADIPPGKYSLYMTGLVEKSKKCVSNAVAFEVTEEKMKLPDAPVRNNVQVVVKLDKEKYAAKKGIAFDIVVKNIDPDTSILIDRFGCGWMLFYDSTGRLVSSDGRELPWDPMLSVAVFGDVPLRPGQIYTSSADLTWAAKIPPGKYTFKLIGKDSSFGEYESNEVTFTVEEPEEE